MNRFTRIALSFGIFFSIANVISSLVFGRDWAWTQPVFAFLFGALVGFLYAVAMKRTMRNIGKSVVIELAAGENKLREDGTTYIKGKAGFPGRLVLTEKQLIFKSKKIDDKDFEERIDRQTIKPFNERNFWMGTVNDLEVSTVDDRTFHFVVYAPEEWIASINAGK